ncbi:hypothetical protein MK489_20505 [Myxococcota bacterium]|nr:hypothetical protein [Myxococcota bacterium]
MAAIFVLDQIRLHPGKLGEFREKLAREYIPAARGRGLQLVDSWLTPPLELEDDGNDLVLLWSLEDLGAFWKMRSLQGADPEGARWWEGTGAWVASRSRKFMTRQEVSA